jgi:hypothetical protein
VARKFDQNQWLAIEKNASPFELQVIEALCKTGVAYSRGEGGGTYVDNTAHKKYCLGLKFDSALFDGLIKSKICHRVERAPDVSSTSTSGKKNSWNGSKKKGSKGPSKKVEKMRRDNAARTASKKIQDVLSTFDMKRLNPQVGFKSDIIELVGATFCYVMAYMIRGKSKFQEERYFEAVMSIIVSAQRFLNTCSDYTGYDMVTPGKKCRISPNIIQMLKNSCARFYETYPFDGMKICRDLPALLVRSVYDKHIPKLGVTPYPHQIEVIDALYSNMVSDKYDGLLAVYSAMIGSGKTTTVVELGALVQNMRLISSKYAHLQLIFICNLESVKTQVANMCYNATLSGFCKFGVAYTTDDDTYRIVNHFSTTDEDRVVVICDPGTAHRILTDRSNDEVMGPVENRFIKFHDEHTIGGDQEGSLPLRQNVDCMMIPTKWTILSSATSPKIEELPRVIERTREIIGRVEMKTIHTNTIHIGINVVTRSEEPVLPYQNCETGDALRASIRKVQEIPFLGRMLTSHVAVDLYERVRRLSTDPSNGIVFEEFPDIPSRFRNVDNMKADAVRSTVLEMLEYVSHLDDEIVADICHSSVQPLESETPDGDANDSESDSDSDSDSDDGIIFEDEVEEEVEETGPTSPFDYHTLGTTGAHRFQVQTLIATNRPGAWTLEHFAPYLEGLEEIGCKSFDRLYSNYTRRLKDFESRKEKMARNIDNEDERSRKLQDFDQDAPKFEFPSIGHINSSEHAKKYGEGKTYHDFRAPIGLEAYVERISDMMVPDRVKLLLVGGVGIYEPTSNLLDKSYLTLVLELAAEGRLAYMVADNSITFGTNYPFGEVIVCEDFSSTHSVYTLFQLLGRAGRVGMSWKAGAMISDSMAAMLVDFTINPDKYAIEAENIDRMVEQIRQDKEDEERREMEKMEAEILKQMEADKPKAPAKILVVHNPRKETGDVVEDSSAKSSSSASNKGSESVHSITTRKSDSDDEGDEDVEDEADGGSWQRVESKRTATKATKTATKTVTKANSRNSRDSRDSRDAREEGPWRRSGSKDKRVFKADKGKSGNPAKGSGKYVPPHARNSERNEESSGRWGRSGGDGRRNDRRDDRRDDHRDYRRDDRRDGPDSSNWRHGGGDNRRNDSRRDDRRDDEGSGGRWSRSANTGRQSNNRQNGGGSRNWRR